MELVDNIYKHIPMQVTRYYKEMVMLLTVVGNKKEYFWVKLYNV
jgi:hypothetical protein